MKGSLSVPSAFPFLELSETDLFHTLKVLNCSVLSLCNLSDCSVKPLSAGFFSKNIGVAAYFLLQGSS